MVAIIALSHYLLLYITSLCVSQVLAGNSFKNKIQGIHDAQDIVFHNELLKQLAHDQHGQPVLDSPSAAIAQTVDFPEFALSSAMSAFQFGDNSTNSIQIYTNGTLPTSPAPPTACASALTASIACNSTVPLMS
jgi:hypothetical protein